MFPTLFIPQLTGKTLGSIDTNEFVIAEWQDPGGPPGPPRLIAPFHVHHRDDEAWYVLEGALRIRAGDKEFDAPIGSAILVPRGTPHTYWNPGRDPVRYLLVMTPNIFRLIQEIHTLTDRSPSALQPVFRKHDAEILDMPAAG